MEDGGHFIRERMFYMGGSWSDHAKGGESFTNTFSSNHFLFSQSWKHMQLKIKPWPKIWKYLYLKLIVKRFQRLCHVQSDLEIFVKLTVQIGDCIKNTPSPHYTSRFGDFLQILQFLYYLEWWPVHWCLDYRTLSDLSLVVG